MCVSLNPLTYTFYCTWQKVRLTDVIIWCYITAPFAKTTSEVPKQTATLIAPLAFALRKAPAVKRLTKKSLSALSTKTSPDSWVFLTEGSFYRAPSPSAEGFITIPFSSSGVLMSPVPQPLLSAHNRYYCTPQQHKQPQPQRVCV